MPDQQSTSATYGKTDRSRAEEKSQSSMTLNSYLYAKPDVVERLIQGQTTTAEGYVYQAAERMAQFNRAFDGNGKGGDE
ncbi:hypothetical protein IFR05_007987 [Cadophora sp. M221]|nr:hypothetical protein IFR05_007987 [Cadophora sp. M221]